MFVFRTFFVARLLVGAVALFFPSSNFGLIIVLYSSFRGRAFGTSLMESNTILLSDFTSIILDAVDSAEGATY